MTDLVVQKITWFSNYLLRFDLRLGIGNSRVTPKLRSGKETKLIEELDLAIAPGYCNPSQDNTP